MNSQARVQNEINLHNQKKKVVNVSWINESGVTEVVETISNTSFTWLATFGRRHHPLPIVYFVPFHEDYMQMSFFVRIRTFVVPNFGHSCLCQIKFFFKRGQYFIALKKIFPMVYNTLQSDLISPLFQNFQFDSCLFLLIIIHTNHI
jgi:hypothetical protein